MDGPAGLDASFRATEKFAVVLGSDLIYERAAAPMLSAAILSHVAEGGVLYLMSPQERPGLHELHALLGAAGSLETEAFTIVHDFGLTPVVLTTFRP